MCVRTALRKVSWGRGGDGLLAASKGGRNLGSGGRSGSGILWESLVVTASGIGVGF